MNELCKREATPIQIGAFTLYCEHFKVIGSSEVNEQMSAAGVSLITNRCKKAVKATFTGRMYNHDCPLGFVDVINNMSNNYKYDISYRGLDFRQCSINGVVIEDKGDDFTYVTITFATSLIVLVHETE